MERDRSILEKFGEGDFNGEINGEIIGWLF